MCGQWGDRGAFRGRTAVLAENELSTGRWLDFIDEIRRIKPNITLFGGEPLLYSGAGEIIGKIKFSGLSGCLITNGMLLEEFADGLVGNKWDDVHVSIDGPEKVHDRIRCRNGSFRKIMDGIKKIQSLKTAYKSDRPRIEIVCTISRDNYEFLPEMGDVALQAGAEELNIHHLIFISQENYSRQKKVLEENFGCSPDDWSGFAMSGLSGREVDRVLEVVEDVKRKSKVPVNFYPNFSASETRRYYLDSDFRSGEFKSRCLSPWNTAYVFPDGDVRPCLSNNCSAGNILDSTFEDIWNNGFFRKYRRFLKKNRLFPACPKCTELYRY